MSICVVFVHLHFPHKCDNTLKTSPILRVMASFADEGLVTGLSRLATQTTVRLGYYGTRLQGVQAPVGVAWREEAESKVPTFGEKHVAWWEHIYLCELVFGLPERTQDQENEGRKEESRPCPLGLSCLSWLRVRLVFALFYFLLCNKIYGKAFAVISEKGSI